MDLLAAGMGIGREGGEEEGLGLGLGEGEGSWDSNVGMDELGGKAVLHLAPGSAEEWIARQGHEGVLLC